MNRDRSRGLAGDRNMHKDSPPAPSHGTVLGHMCAGTVCTAWDRQVFNSGSFPESAELDFVFLKLLLAAASKVGVAQVYLLLCGALGLNR